MPAIRPEIVERAMQFIAKFKSDPEVTALARGGQEGTAFELAQVKESPRALTLEKRVPHIMDRSGNLLWSGEEGTFHQEGLEEAFGKVRQTNPQAKPTDLVFVHELPKHTTWELRGQNLSDSEFESVVGGLQSRFAKPIIDPNPASNKMYAVGGGIAATGATVPTQEQKEQDPLLQKIAEVRATQDPLKKKIEAIRSQLQKQEQTQEEFPAEVAEELSHQERIINKVKNKYSSFVANLWDTPDYEMNPETKATIGQLAGLNVEPAYFLPDPERDIKLLARAPGDIQREGATVQNVLNPVFGALDLAFLGVASKALASWGSKFRRVSKTEDTSKIPTPEQVTQDFAKERVHTEEAAADPTVVQMEQLQFEFEKYYSKGMQKAEQRLLQQEDISRTSLLVGKPGHLTGKQPYSGAYEKLQPAGKDMPEGTDLFPGFKSEGPSKTPSKPPTPAHIVAAEANETMLAFTPEQPLYKAAWRRGISATITALRSTNKVGEDIARRIMKYTDEPARATAAKLVLLKPLLSKLSKKEKENYFNVLDDAYYNVPDNPALYKHFEGIKPISKNVSQAVELSTVMSKEVTDRARTLGLDVVEISRGFMPHILTGKKASEKAFLDYLKKTKQAANDQEAKVLFNQWAKRYADMEFKGLEKARTLHVKGYQNYKSLGFETDPLKLWESYFFNSHKRIESILQFGEKGHKEFDRLNTLLASTHPNDAYIADALFKRTTNRLVLDTILQKMISKIVNFHVVTYMGLAGPMQLASIGNVLIKMGWRRTALGTYSSLKTLFSKEGDVLSERTGAIFQNVTNDLREMYGTGWVSDTYLKMVGVTKLDEVTRRLAVHSGKYWLDDILRGLKKDPKHPYWNKAAKELFLDTKELARSGYKMAPEAIDLALQRISNATIGRTRGTEMSLWLGSPGMNLITLFKKFMVFQTKFMKDNAFKEVLGPSKASLAKRTSTLSAFLLGQYPLGYLLGETRSAITGRERPEGLSQIVDNLAFVQAFGMYLDLAMAASKGTGRTLSWIAGPALTNISQSATALYNSLENLSQGYTTLDDHKALVKKLSELTLKPVPYVGPRIHVELMDNLYPEMRIKEAPVPRR